MTLNGANILFDLVHDKKGLLGSYGSLSAVLASIAQDYDSWLECLDIPLPDRVPDEWMCAWYQIQMVVDGIVQAKVDGSTFRRLAGEYGFCTSEGVRLPHNVQSHDAVRCVSEMLRVGEAVSC